jgi:Peptidase family M23
VIRLSTVLTLALACPAGAFELEWPLDCTLGDTCHIQQYVDHDPGPAATDFTCGPLSYDGHDGTDIALPTRADMAAGVSVLAAAAGTVGGMRDTVADLAPVVPGKECGNGVVIDHGEGWVTQYCHMRRGSLVVQPGQQVSAGTVLGLVGQSGQADFPHLHLSVRHDGVEVDPFQPEAGSCALTPGATLWATPVPYEPGGFLAAGFYDAIPQFDALRAGLETSPLPATAPGLVVWAYAFGTRSGDRMVFQVTGPDGDFLTQDVAIDKTQAQMFRAVGKRLTTAGWAPGPYHGTVRLLRDGVEIDRIEARVAVVP